jgi:hypothetical protein
MAFKTVMSSAIAQEIRHCHPRVANHRAASALEQSVMALFGLSLAGGEAFLRSGQTLLPRGQFLRHGVPNEGVTGQLSCMTLAENLIERCGIGDPSKY